jgi:hypothetical protein
MIAANNLEDEEEEDTDDARCVLGGSCARGAMLLTEDLTVLEGAPAVPAGFLLSAM